MVGPDLADSHAMRSRWFALALLLAAAAGCRTTPTTEDLQRAELGAPPEQRDGEAAAQRLLASCPDAPAHANVEFGSFERGWYRLGSLGAAHVAWCLEAHVSGDRWLFYFDHERLVAVGSMQPLCNRTTTSAQWLVVELDTDGALQQGHTLDLPRRTAPAAASPQR